MNDHFTGGCACGAVRYEISSDPIFTNDCQCRDCQRRSGTRHGSYLTFPHRTDVKLTGQAKLFDVIGDSGNVKTHAFCATCGSPVYLTFAANPVLFTVHAASLDDPSRYKPQAVTYGIRGYAGTISIRLCRNSIKCRREMPTGLAYHICASHRQPT